MILFGVYISLQRCCVEQSACYVGVNDWEMLCADVRSGPSSCSNQGQKGNCSGTGVYEAALNSGQQWRL